MKDIKYEIEEYPYNDLEMYRTDLAEYSFMLEQEYKKKVIPQQFKKKKI